MGKYSKKLLSKVQEHNMKKIMDETDDFGKIQITMTGDLVIGMGEVGETLQLLLVKRGIKCQGIDVIRDKDFVKCDTDVMHVCIPSIDNFENIIMNYIKEFNPKYCIIHSTVSENTTKSIQSKTPIPIIYSPVRGVHSNFLHDMERYTKFYACDMTVEPDVMNRRFIKTHRMSDTRTLELAKVLVDTTYYGVLIAYRKMIDDMLVQRKLDPNEAWLFANEIHQFLGNRPVMWNDFKPIGGHCVKPNLRLLGSDFKEIVDFIEKF